MKSDYDNFTREELVEEYLSAKLASIVNFVGTDWRFMPMDVPQSPEYWKKIDGNIHDMHIRIAELYHIDRNDCLWLENIIDSDNLYITGRKFKPLLKDSIKWLEEAEEKALENDKTAVGQTKTESHRESSRI